MFLLFAGLTTIIVHKIETDRKKGVYASVEPKSRMLSSTRSAK